MLVLVFLVRVGEFGVRRLFALAFDPAAEERGTEFELHLERRGGALGSGRPRAGGTPRGVIPARSLPLGNLSADDGAREPAPAPRARRGGGGFVLGARHRVHRRPSFSLQTLPLRLQPRLLLRLLHFFPVLLVRGARLPALDDESFLVVVHLPLSRRLLLLELVELPRLLLDVHDGVRVDADVVQDTNRLLEITHGVTLHGTELLFDRLALARGHLHLAHHVLRKLVVPFQRRVDGNHGQVAANAVVGIANLLRGGRGRDLVLVRGRLGERSAVGRRSHALQLVGFLVGGSPAFIVILRVGVVLLADVITKLGGFVSVTGSLSGRGGLVGVVLSLVHESGDLIIVFCAVAPAPAAVFVVVRLGRAHRAHGLVEDVHRRKARVATDNVRATLLIFVFVSGT